MTEFMGDLAAGETGKAVPGTDRGDEIGRMAAAVQVFKDAMSEADRLALEQRKEQQAREQRTRRVDELTRAFDSSVTEVLTVVTSSTSDMETTAQAMSRTADNTAHQAGTVATASEQTSDNVTTVASATEEMTASMAEVSSQVSRAHDVAQDASRKARDTDKTMVRLKDAAAKIGNVMEMINDIAEQTNLLALNATIEAARAGEAGKGFAVVASEVKNLATQTARATQEIAEEVTTMQDVSRDAAQEIQSISATIDEINTVSEMIAAAIEEQTSATHEIARSSQDAASHTESVQANVVTLRDASENTGSAAGEVSSAAASLSSQAQSLKQAIDGMLSDLRAA